MKRPDIFSTNLIRQSLLIMLVAIGTKVILAHSKDRAVVTALLSEGMVMVRLLDDDMEIPVFTEDLLKMEGQQASPAKAEVVAGKQDKNAAVGNIQTESQATLMKGYGIQLAFAPVLYPDASVEKYEIYLINDTPFPVIFTFSMELDGRTFLQKNGRLLSAALVSLGELQFDQLNDAPACLLECRRIMTDGTGSAMKKNLKIKPKQFFKNIQTAPLLNRPVHLYLVFESLIDRSAPEPKEEDLKTYTQRNTAPSLAGWTFAGERIPHEVVEFAEFLPEIDLHIDKIEPHHKKLNKSSILRLQMKHFEEYLDKAIRLGVERVFVIHGLGEGRLKNEIAGRLLQTPEVVTFKNEYHPRYGYGATEIILK